MTAPDLVWQPTLTAGDEPTIDGSFATATRVALDATAWIDVVPAWVGGADRLFGELVERARWQGHTRRMYDRVVDEPRLRAPLLGDTALLAAVPVVERMRAALSDRYGVEFDSGGLNLYRDGRDSVAWHGDRIPKEIVDPLVCVVSLGSPRRFLLRPKGGGRSVVFLPAPGDLLVTGGTCQRTWDHSIPKTATAGPRISMTFRHR